MCGIVGYIGEQQAAPILLDGLSKLEYRGYDSAGVAVYDGEKIQMVKATGRLKVLEELTQDGAVLPGTSGIGHTRWATHGSPSDANAHPHFNKDQSIVVVHNGIIENYVKLKKKMESRGYQFVSETDTEVIAHMLDYYYNGNPLDTIVGQTATAFKEKVEELSGGSITIDIQASGVLGAENDVLDAMLGGSGIRRASTRTSQPASCRMGLLAAATMIANMPNSRKAMNTSTIASSTLFPPGTISRL